MRTDTTQHAAPSAAIRFALQELGGPPPRSAFIGLAGRVDGPVARLTNAPWVVDAAWIGSELNLEKVVLLNDYIPVAAATLLLDPEHPGELVRIGPVLPGRQGLRLALGPGTGFGAAACLPVQDRYWLQSTEAGHTDFGACTPEDLALWPLIEAVGGRISAETLLSGPGLVRLYHATANRIGIIPACNTPADVLLAAESGAASEALRHFVSLLGRFAGDLALILSACGGVFLGSGIPPRIIDVLGRGEFRSAFERKTPFETVMSAVPTFVIIHPEPAMAGLAMIASHPDRFMFEAHGWSLLNDRVP